MHNHKIEAGADFPDLFARNLEGKESNISKPYDGADWHLVIVYRGKHCPLCTNYLNKFEDYIQPLKDIGISVAAVSGDSEAQLTEHKKELHVSFPLYYGLTIEQMQKLGLYISHPRSEQETDHPFAEPGLFVINSDGHVQLVDISNGPFSRPELEPLVGGLAWIRDPANNYPIRGTYK